jgi:hypothetical protein
MLLHLYTLLPLLLGGVSLTGIRTRRRSSKSAR